MISKEKTVIVASGNPVKIEAACRGVRKNFQDFIFKAVAVAVSSDVPDQPMSDEETLKGAINRVNNAFATNPEADFWIGIEGGVQAHKDELAAFARVVVRSAEGSVFNCVDRGARYSTCLQL